MPEAFQAGPEAFLSVFRNEELDDQPVMVGGQAVNLWAERYLPFAANDLAEFELFVSKDLDLVGGLKPIETLCKRLGKFKMGEPRGPVAGQGTICLL